MADWNHLEIIKQGPDAWNAWRKKNPEMKPSLRRATLSRMDLSEANLLDADLSGASLIDTDLHGATLSRADLIGSDLRQSNLVRVDLRKAKLIGANLSGANLVEARLREADLSDANLKAANLIATDFVGASFGTDYNSHADLSYADLSGADFTGTNLNWANFGNANLFKAQLSEANLSHAVFREAELTYANLSGADLRHANLSKARLVMATLRDVDLRSSDLRLASFDGADLSGANLSDASLSQTIFSETNLNGADLSGSRMGQIVFANIDLSLVKGLETVHHLGPSTIGVDTFYKTNSRIPDVFLRGVGLPEVFLTYLPSLIARPIEFYSCFISYSHADKSFARRLHDTLQGRGIRCWLDEHELLPGDKIFTEVDRGIRLWDKVLLCCSKAALTSWWVDNEIKIAFDKEQKLWRQREKEVLSLIPLNLDDYLFSGKWQSGLATEVKARMAGDFNGWDHDNTKFEEQFERLVKALRTDGRGKNPVPPSKL